MNSSEDFEKDSFIESEEEDDNDEDEVENFINKTYVCEDCDFRWTDKVYPERNDFPDYDDEMGFDHVCPMCGSMNVSFY